ncbi:MAG: hypothetical protein KC431_02500, partial [Myxococcales bacterium]|nr:hypothetical protein [Myxococcales bacterium]
MQRTQVAAHHAARGSVQGAILLGALLGTSLIPAAAQAAPPTAQDFQVTYYVTDEHGDRANRMSAELMEGFVNIARCECQQDIYATILLTTYDSADQIRVMVGQQCAMAQALPGISNYYPCAQLMVGLPQDFTKQISLSFEPKWLAWGSTGDQTIESATPAGGCDTQATEAGIWMCSGATDCTMGNFFMSG